MTRSIPLCIALLVVAGGEAAAEPIVFNTAGLTTSGVFVCLKDPACSAFGSSVTLGSGSGAVTLTFTGVNTVVPMSNETVLTTLGTLSASSSSATFPTRTNQALPILGFNLTLEHTSPVASSLTRHLRFGPGGQTMLRYTMGTSYFQLNPGPVPAGYGSMVYTFTIPDIPMNGSADITADAGVVPEPATMALVGIGLAGAAARRKQSVMLSRVSSPSPAGR
jgi:hypothetical protein